MDGAGRTPPVRSRTSEFPPTDAATLRTAPAAAEHHEAAGEDDVVERVVGGDDAHGNGGGGGRRGGTAMICRMFADDRVVGDPVGGGRVEG